MALRDLRDDLRERIRVIDLQRAEISARLKHLEATQNHLEQLLTYEEMRVRSEGNNLSFPFLPSAEEMEVEQDRSVIALFLQDKLSDGQSWRLSDLKEAAKEYGLDFGTKNPGRVLHFALLGMTHGGSVEMVEKGVWRMRGENKK